jgi:acyl-CoA reductase-like NAD-dependent aldehyde dehydrogenase
MATIDWQQRALNIDLNIHNFISGEYAEAQQGKFLHKYSPRDGSFLYRVPVGTPAEMESAILSANLAYRDNRWSGLTLHQRQTLLRKLADLLDIHQERIGLYECLDTGKPITQALGEVAMASGIIRAAVNDADKVLSSRFSDGAYCTYQIHRSIGIVGAIIPWNYPLVIAAKKIGAALVNG